MTQQPDGIRRDADLHGVTSSLPPAADSPPPPDEFVQAVHFVLLTIGLYIVYAFCLSVAFTSLRNSGFYAWFYGSQFVNAAFDPKNPQPDAQTRLQLWAVAVAFPCWLIPTAVACWFLPKVYRRDLGASLGRFSQKDDKFILKRYTIVPRAVLSNVLLGLGVWLLIAPTTFGINWFVGWLYTRFIEVKPEEHPLTAAAQNGGLLRVEWLLLAFGVMVSAPLWEELLFRGLLPALLRKLRGKGGHAAMTLALATALLLRRNQLSEASSQGFTPLLLAAMPALFVVALLPIYAIVCWRSRTENGPIIFGTALLFAAVHSFAWPTPVALFILGLGLGWLAAWTRSLLAPILVHSLFNAVSLAILYFD